MVIAGVSKTRCRHFGEVILKGPEESLEDLCWKGLLVGSISSPPTLRDLPTKPLQTPLRRIRQNHTLCQLHGARLVAFLLRVHDVFGKALQAPGVVGVIEIGSLQSNRGWLRGLSLLRSHPQQRQLEQGQTDQKESAN